MDLSRYKLEPLHRDGELLLYRGVPASPAEGGPPSVLVLAPADEYASPATLKRLEHEYSLASELDPRWAVRPVALVRHQDRTALVLDDPGGEPLDRLLGKPMGMGAAFLRLAISLARAVGSVHAAGLIHKDIKPANTLVDFATGRVWLKGFGIASRLRRERQPPEPLESVAGTLAYMAPEQTGRMNRSIDSRSDLYSLGVTLYRMLTGSLPFNAADPLEWVHCHIARRPVPPAERLSHVPAPVSSIVMKLLAKAPEERYQTAAGVERDLRRCLVEWEAQRRIGDFPLGEDDTPARLLIPEKLYGRERGIETLLAAFDRVVNGGAPELVLVAGYSGIGKSSVINELHKVLVPPHGLFASGKFDQYRRDIPYSTLAQAFRSLVRPLLGKSDTELSGWLDALREALGPNGRLMVDVVPELKLIIGEQLRVPALPPRDAQQRLHLVFRRFIGVFARPEHPLALFLDDLQWLDAATLDLLEDLLSRSDLQHFMLIGAYRDNEVTAAHPLMRKLDAITAAGGRVSAITLAPLAGEHLEQLVADALRCDPELAAPLAQLVHEKTAGNPLFVIQFISSLADEGLLTFDHVYARWSWDLGRIRAKGYTDNVVDLMVGKLTRLSADTQKALQQLACLGNAASVRTLSMVRGTAEVQVHSDLWEAVRAELVERQGDSYKFIHDRVQEAAYSLMPEELRAEEHLRIGRLLGTHTPPDEREEAIFEIVNHLNRGVAVITEREEREQVAELNLIAGKRAETSTAYASALNFFIAGAALLPKDSWERRYGLTFELELHRAECEFLTGELAAAEERLSMLSNRTASLVDLSAVTCLRVAVDTTLDRSDRAVDVCLEHLRRVGVVWSPHPTQAEVEQEIALIWQQLGSRPIEALSDLPPMTDAACRATMNVLVEVFAPALYTNENLLCLVTGRMVNLSLQHGNSDASCIGYVYLGAILGAQFGEYEAGFRFGKLGLALVEKPGFERYKARVYLSFADLVNPWARHIQTGMPLLRRALEAVHDTGDLTLAGYSWSKPLDGMRDWTPARRRGRLVSALLAIGDPLAEVEREAERGLDFARKTGFGLMIEILTGQLRLVRALRGRSGDGSPGNDARGFDEESYEQRLDSDPRLAIASCWYWIRKLQAHFFAADYGAALEAIAKAERLLWTSPSFFEIAEYHFYAALVRAACCDRVPADERPVHLGALLGHHRQLAAWAENCPENFENRAALIGAEIARIEGRVLDAMDLYERAITSARANRFVHNEAVGGELAARFYAARGFETISDAYLRNARYCYVRWGADGKVRRLDMLYPQLRDEPPNAGPTSMIGGPVEQLDLATVIKVSQAVSGELVLEKVVETLLRTAIEHAGAERGLLVLPRGSELSIHAEATTSGSSVMVRLREAPISAAELPESVVRYAARTQESVILDDASGRNPFSGDEYIRRRHARSVLCSPLVKRGGLVAVLYLENNLAPNVFTPARIAVLQLLASEAAMSLDNSRLYGELREREGRILRLVDANIIGVVIVDLGGPIIEANDAFLDMLGYSRDDLVTERLRWDALMPTEWHPVTQRAIAEIRATGRCTPYEKEYIRKDGSRVPALVGGAAFEENRTQAVFFVLDLSRWKGAEEALQRTQAELAHVARVATLGELAGSIAHEINQPLGAVVNNASACLRWLAAQNLEEARQSAARVIVDGHRASEIIGRIRTLAKKAPPRRDWVDINDTLREVLVLAQSEVQRQRVSLQTRLTAALPPVWGDRIQVQQVMLNLLMNAIEALSGVGEGLRELGVETDRESSGDVVITVRDSGPGLEPTSLDRLFDAFYTTKPDGLGMGLAISRSIVESHGGRLWATGNTPHGAVFRFTLPVGRAA